VSVDWTETLGRLVADSSLTREEANLALAEILAGDVDDAVKASFLTALTAKGETAEEMTGFVDAMVAAAETFEVPVETIDLVGTGGDQLHTVNITTMAALTVAGVGVPVAKHGNRAASGSVGAADVLEALGVRIDAGPEVVVRCVSDAGIGFCFAQRFHPGLRHLGPVRRSLGFPTIFNVLGPLANPAGVRRMLVGVASDAMIERMANVLAARGVDHAILVHSDDGLDELSLGAPSTVIDVIGHEFTSTRFDPDARFGRRHEVRELVGGDVVTNVGAVEDYLNGEPGAVHDTVVANAAIALVAAGSVESFEAGIDAAESSVGSGAARRALDRLIAVSNA
jgi:anthranilate phosphoribosyltransferase